MNVATREAYHRLVGMAELETELHGDDARPAPRMYAEVSGRETVTVPATWELAADRVRGWVYVSWRTRRIWWQPVREPRGFHQVSTLTLRPLSGRDLIRAERREPVRAAGTQ
jgi:hypothetical protein